MVCMGTCLYCIVLRAYIHAQRNTTRTYKNTCLYICLELCPMFPLRVLLMLGDLVFGQADKLFEPANVCVQPSIQQSTSNMHRVACSMLKPAAHHTQHETLHCANASMIQVAPFNMQRATRRTQHEACDMSRAIRNMTHNMQHRATCNLQHAACSMHDVLR